MPSPYGELTVIVNPHAGRRRVGEEIPELERTLRSRGLPYRLHRTEGPGDATRLAREGLEAGGRFVVAVGGDGTVNEVVNGMFDDEGKSLVPDAILGVVAAGSGCDFVRTFGLPGDATRAGSHRAELTTASQPHAARSHRARTTGSASSCRRSSTSPVP